MICKFTEFSSLTINGVETIDMDINNFKNTLKQLINKEEDIAVLQDIFMKLMYCQGEVVDTYIDDFGDSYDTYEVEINDENSSNE